MNTEIIVTYVDGTMDTVTYQGDDLAGVQEEILQKKKSGAVPVATVRTVTKDVDGNIVSDLSRSYMPDEETGEGRPI